MKLTVSLTLAALLMVALTADVAAQRGPSGAPQVNLGDSTQYPQGRTWSGPPRVDLNSPNAGSGYYFQPTPYPYQGSYTRQWRSRLQQFWGSRPYNQGVPQVERQYGFPNPGPGVVYGHPYSWPNYQCWGTRCPRTWPPFR